MNSKRQLIVPYFFDRTLLPEKRKRVFSLPTTFRQAVAILLSLNVLRMRLHKLPRAMKLASYLESKHFRTAAGLLIKRTRIIGLVESHESHFGVDFYLTDFFFMPSPPLASLFYPEKTSAAVAILMRMRL